MKQDQGFSLAEVLAVIIVLGLVMGPATDILRSALQVETINRSALEAHYHLIDHTEFLLAEPFDSLAAAVRGESQESRYSDAVGVPNRRLVFISPFDADNADADNDESSGTDAGILKIRVLIENTATEVSVLKADSV